MTNFHSYCSQWKKRSSAEELIKGFPPAGESHSIAVSKLESRFGTKDLLIVIYGKYVLCSYICSVKKY